MGHPILFYAFSALMLAGALGVVLAKHPVYAVLCLVLTLCSLSGLFVLLGALFVAIVQILIYAGAVLVLFLFVVMLLDTVPEVGLQTKGGTLRILGLLFGIVFFWELTIAARAFIPAAPQQTVPPVSGTTAAVGKALFTTYALPFEIASLLLLVGVIGAVVLAKKKV